MKCLSWGKKKIYQGLLEGEYRGQSKAVWHPRATGTCGTLGNNEQEQEANISDAGSPGDF